MQGENFNSIIKLPSKRFPQFCSKNHYNKHTIPQTFINWPIQVRHKVPRTLRLAKQKYQHDETECSISRESDIAFKWHFNFTERFFRCAMCQFSKINIARKFKGRVLVCFCLSPERMQGGAWTDHNLIWPWIPGNALLMLQSLCVISVKHSVHCPMQGVQKAGVGSRSTALSFLPEGRIGLGSKESEVGLPAGLVGLLLSLLGDLS